MLCYARTSSLLFRSFSCILRRSSSSQASLVPTRAFHSHHVHRNITKKSIESTYVKKTPIEHVLERPDAYVGTTESISKVIFSNFLSLFIHVKNVFIQENDKIERRMINYVPALYRVIDELLMNAVDNHHRQGTGTNEIKVEINANEGY